MFLIQYNGAINLILPSIFVGFAYVIFFNDSLFQISTGNTMNAVKKNLEIFVLFVCLIFSVKIFYELTSIDMLYLLFLSFILVFLKNIVFKYKSLSIQEGKL